MLIVIMSNYQVKNQLLENYNLVDDMLTLTILNYSKKEKISVDMLYKTEMMFLNTLSSIYTDLYDEDYDDIENKQRLLMLCANKKINIYHNKTKQEECDEEIYKNVCDLTKHQVEVCNSYIKSIVVC